jgi:hypothetical protein
MDPLPMMWATYQICHQLNASHAQVMRSVETFSLWLLGRINAQVIDTDAKLYRSWVPHKVLAQHERRKQKYLNACLQQHKSTTLLLSCLPMTWLVMKQQRCSSQDSHCCVSQTNNNDLTWWLCAALWMLKWKSQLSERNSNLPMMISGTPPNQW